MAYLPVSCWGCLTRGVVSNFCGLLTSLLRLSDPSVASIFCGLLTTLLLLLSDPRCGIHFLWLAYQSPVGAAWPEVWYPFFVACLPVSCWGCLTRGVVSIFCGLLTSLLLGLSDPRCGIHFLWLAYQSPVGALPDPRCGIHFLWLAYQSPVGPV